MVSKRVENSLKVIGFMAGAVGGYAWWCGRSVRVGQTLLGLGTILETLGFMGAEKPPKPKVDLNKHLRESLEEQAQEKKDRSNEEAIDLGKQMVQAKCDKKLIADLIRRQVTIEGFTDQLRKSDNILPLILAVSEVDTENKIFSQEEIDQYTIMDAIKNRGENDSLAMIAVISNQYPNNAWWKEQVRSIATECPTLPVDLLKLAGGETAYNFFSVDELKASYFQASEEVKYEILCRPSLDPDSRLAFKYVFPLLEEQSEFKAAIALFIEDYFFKCNTEKQHQVFVEEMTGLDPYIRTDARAYLNLNLNKWADSIGPLAFTYLDQQQRIRVLEKVESVDHLVNALYDAEVLDLVEEMIKSKRDEKTIEKILIAGCSREPFAKALWKRIQNPNHMLIDAIISNGWQLPEENLQRTLIAEELAEMLARRESDSLASLENLLPFIPIGDALKEVMTAYANAAFFPSIFRRREPVDKKDWALRRKNFNDDMYSLSDQRGRIDLLRHMIANHTYKPDEATPEGAKAARTCLEKLEQLASSGQFWLRKSEVKKIEKYKMLDFSLMYSFKHDEWTKGELQAIAEKVPPFAFALLKDEQKVWVLEAASKNTFESLIKVLHKDQLIEHTDKLMDFILAKAITGGNDEESKTWKQLATVDLQALRPDLQEQVLSKLMIRRVADKNVTFAQLDLLLDNKTLKANADALVHQFLDSFFSDVDPILEKGIDVTGQMDWLKENKSALFTTLMMTLSANYTREDLEGTQENVAASRACFMALEILAKDKGHWLSQKTVMEAEEYKAFDPSLMYSFKHDAWNQEQLQAIADKVPPLAFPLLSPEQRVWVLGAASDEAKRSLLKVLNNEQCEACYKAAPQAFAAILAGLMVADGETRLSFEQLLPSLGNVQALCDVAKEFAHLSFFSSFFSQEGAREIFAKEMSWLKDNEESVYGEVIATLINNYDYGQIEATPANADSARQCVGEFVKLASDEKFWWEANECGKFEAYKDFDLPLIYSFQRHEWTKVELQAIAEKVPPLAFALLSVEQKTWVLEAAPDKADAFLAVLDDEQVGELGAQLAMNGKMEGILDRFSEEQKLLTLELASEDAIKHLVKELDDEQVIAFTEKMIDAKCDRNAILKLLIKSVEPNTVTERLVEMMVREDKESRVTFEQVIPLLLNPKARSDIGREFANRTLFASFFANGTEELRLTFVDEMNWLAQNQRDAFEEVIGAVIDRNMIENLDATPKNAEAARGILEVLEWLTTENQWHKKVTFQMEAAKFQPLDLPLMYSFRNDEWSRVDVCEIAHKVPPLAFALLSVEQKAWAFEKVPDRKDAFLAVLDDKQAGELGARLAVNGNMEGILDLFSEEQKLLTLELASEDAIKELVKELDDEQVIAFTEKMIEVKCDSNAILKMIDLGRCRENGTSRLLTERLVEMMIQEDEGSRVTFEQVIPLLHDPEARSDIGRKFASRTLFASFFSEGKEELRETFIKEMNSLAENQPDAFDEVIGAVIDTNMIEKLEVNPKNVEAARGILEVLDALPMKPQWWDKETFQGKGAEFQPLDLPLMYSFQHHDWTRDELHAIAKNPFLAINFPLLKDDEQKLWVLEAAGIKRDPLLAALSEEEKISVAGVALKDKGVEKAVNLLGVDLVQSYIQEIDDAHSLLGEMMVRKDETRATFEQVDSILFEQSMLIHVVEDFIERCLFVEGKMQLKLFEQEMKWLKGNRTDMFDEVIQSLICRKDFDGMEDTRANADTIGAVVATLESLTDKRHWLQLDALPHMLSLAHTAKNATWTEQELQKLADDLSPLLFAQLSEEQRGWVLAAANGRTEELNKVLAE